MDGSRTDRSEAVSASCKWITAKEQEKLFKSRPVKGEIGIVYAPESQVHTYALRRTTDPYAKSMQGCYQGFFDRNIQADFVHIDDINSTDGINAWDTLYLPYPVMLSTKTIAALKGWVKAGGILIAEGCPAYFSDMAHAGTSQPGFGMDELFGVKETYVEFTPDLLGNLALSVAGDRIWGGEYLQCYEATTGEAVGWYDDGRIAAVDNQYGKGRTRLIGTMAGYGYYTHGGAEGNYCPASRTETSFFEGILKFAGKTARVRVSDNRLTARLHDGPGGTFLWIANPKRQAIPAQIEILQGKYQEAVPVLGPVMGRKDERFNVTVPARYVIIYELK
jgi:beta-galactosidase